MAKTAALRVNPLPRQLKQLTDRQDRFIRHYAVSCDQEESLKYAGYSVGDPATMATQVSRLLKNAKCRALLDELRAQIAAEHGLDRNGVVNRLKSVYLCACEDRDWSGAVAALREMGKVFGIYETHNRQKKYSAEDVAAIKQRLVEAGMNFTEVNKPKSIPGPEQSEPVNVVEVNSEPTSGFVETGGTP